MARPPFVVGVVALRRAIGRRESVVTHGRLPGMAVTGVAVPDQASVSVAVTLEAIEGGIVARGQVQAPWVGECRRCLTELSGEVVAEVDEVFVADPEEGVTWPIEHNQIDLEPMVRQAVVLELPLAPLCRADCAGLCPSCGKDLNLGPCACPAPPGHLAWAALDVLRSDPPTLN
jgi:uncharacterized protein